MAKLIPFLTALVVGTTGCSYESEPIRHGVFVQKHGDATYCRLYDRGRNVGTLSDFEVGGESFGIHLSMVPDRDDIVDQDKNGVPDYATNLSGAAIAKRPLSEADRLRYTAFTKEVAGKCPLVSIR